MHIVHIQHIYQHIYIGYCLVLYMFCIFCIFKMKRVFPWCPSHSSFISTIAWSPIQGPSCSHTATNIHRHCPWFIAKGSGKVYWFSPHANGYCPSLALWNRRKASQHGGDWNDIHDLFVFPALIDEGRLTVIYPGWGEKQIKDVVYAEYTEYAKYAEYNLVFLAHCTPPARKHRHTSAAASQRRSLLGAEACRTRCYPSWAENRHLRFRAGG